MANPKMSRLSRLMRMRWFRWLTAIGVIILACSLFACVRLNVPFAANAPLATFQSAWGTHQGGRLADIEFIGHRGSALRNPSNNAKPIGNTAGSIRAGIDAGVDWIEIDIRRTSDGKLVLFHDEELGADTNAKEGRVADSTLEALLGLEVSVDPPEHILTLEQFGKTFSEKMADNAIGLILDIKVPGVRTQVLDWVAASGMDRARIVIFGEYGILAEYQESGFKLGYTFTWKGRGNRLLYLFQQSEIVDRLAEIKASFLVIPYIFCSEDLVREAGKSGVSTWAYGSENPRDWEKVRKLGVTGLIVDDPENAVEQE